MSESSLDVRMRFKPTEAFQYMMYAHFSSCHSRWVKKGFIKGKALRHLRTNSSKRTFEENIIKSYSTKDCVSEVIQIT